MKKQKRDRKSIILILLIAVALGAGIGAGTYAFFTAVVNGNTNTVTAGKLETTLDNENIAIGTGGNNISLGNVQPGSTINYNFKVTNGASTIDQKYKITFINNNSGASNDLASAALYDMTITNGSDTTTKTALTYSQFVTELAKVRTLAHQSEKNEYQFNVVITIPTSLGNEYQEAQANFQLRVDATQTADTTF